MRIWTGGTAPTIRMISMIMEKMTEIGVLPPLSGGHTKIVIDKYE
jgi:hypothetical protein